MRLQADFYDVQGSGREWTATIFQGSHVIDEIEAVSEKQAHFLAQQEYPEAKTPGQCHADFMKQYYSPEGYAYRAKNK